MVLVRYKVSKEDLATSNFMLNDDFIVKSVIIPSNRHALARYDVVRILFLLMKPHKRTLQMILLQWNARNGEIMTHLTSEHKFSARYEVQESVKGQGNRSETDLNPLILTQQIGISTPFSTSSSLPTGQDATILTDNHQEPGAPHHIPPQIMQISFHPEDVVCFQSMSRSHWIYCAVLVIEEDTCAGPLTRPISRRLVITNSNLYEVVFNLSTNFPKVRRCRL